MSSEAEALIRLGLARGLTITDLTDAVRVVSREQEGGTRETVHQTAESSARLNATLLWRDSLDQDGPLQLDTSPPAAAGQQAQTIPELPRYEDLSQLGTGGMGEVRRVRDRRLGRTLALKTLHVPAKDRPEVAARFLGEAQATAQLQHPGIVPIHDLGELPDGRLWFTMKEVSGQTLGEVIRAVHAVSTRRWYASTSGWTLRRMIDALRRVCEAVSYAHGRGVVHRDLKPENIMVGSHGEVLVLDWGLAKVLNQAVHTPDSPIPAPIQTDRTQQSVHLTLAGQVAGTPAYMPPEQARGDIDDIDARSDVYSLGAILYEMLSGHAPFTGSTAHGILRQVLVGPPTPLTTGEDPLEPVGLGRRKPLSEQDGPPLPPALVVACERAMAREPAARFQTAAALAHALADWLDGAKKREEALNVVFRAHDRADRAMELRSRAATLRKEAIQLLDGVAPWQPESEKRIGWATEDEAAALERQAELEGLEEEQLLHASLTHAPDLSDAHAALAERYRVEHRSAETARQDTARAEARLRQHLAALPEEHPSHPLHVAYLQGNGALSLHTDPPGAEVLLHRYEEENRRLVPVFERSLGMTPLHAVPMPMGSYLCVLRHPHRADVHYPIAIGRQQHWDGIPPEGGAAVPIALPRRRDLGADDCYIPAGWYWSGGDPEASHSLPRRRLWVDGHIFRRFPVINSEYIAFLDDLVANGRTQDALRYAPRERAGTVGEQGSLIYGFDGTRFCLRPDADGDVWEPDVPVFMVDWFGASAFAAWEAARSSRPWQLPGELAWEKAARGVDGRCFPWGDHFDASRACMRDSHSGRILPASIHAHPIDESPYGVRGMAGNAADWCADASRDGPVLKSSRVEAPTYDGEAASVRVTRGGGWYSEVSHLRAADRYWNSPTSRTISLGFRLARPFGM